MDRAERETFENQENLEKYIPLLEAESEADLTPSMRDYFAKLREYRQTPHVKGIRLVRQLDRTRQQCAELPEDAAR